MLPISRDKTYAALDKFNRSHGTHWQDIARALHQDRHGVLKLQLAACDAWSDANWTFNGTVYNATAGGDVVLPIVLHAGAKVRVCTVGINRAAAASVTATIRSYALATGGSGSSHGSANPAGTGWTTAQLLSSPVVLAAGRVYFVVVVATAAGDQLSGVELEYEH